MVYRFAVIILMKVSLVACGGDAGTLRGSGDLDPSRQAASGAGAESEAPGTPIGTPPPTNVPPVEPPIIIPPVLPPPEKPPETPPVDLEPPVGGYIPFPWDGNPNSDKWNLYADAAIQQEGKDLLRLGSQDVAGFCPNYRNLNELGKRMFWISLVSAMAKHESNYDPSSSQTVAGPAGDIIKRGLLRVDIDRAKVHECAVDNGAELHDPRKNLTCSVKILNYWVLNEGYIMRKQGNAYQGAARVWPSLQKGTQLVDIQNITKFSDVCQ